MKEKIHIIVKAIDLSFYSESENKILWYNYFIVVYKIEFNNYFDKNNFNF